MFLAEELLVNSGTSIVSLINMKTLKTAVDQEPEVKLSLDLLGKRTHSLNRVCKKTHKFRSA